MNGPAEIDRALDDPWEDPCSCPPLPDGRATGVYFRDRNRRPGRQWACRKCGGVAPLQPGPAVLDVRVGTGLGWPS